MATKLILAPNSSTTVKYTMYNTVQILATVLFKFQSLKKGLMLKNYYFCFAIPKKLWLQSEISIFKLRLNVYHNYFCSKISNTYVVSYSSISEVILVKKLAFIFWIRLLHWSSYTVPFLHHRPQEGKKIYRLNTPIFCWS